MPDGFHTEIRKQVAKNITCGVKYRYFVESDAGVERISHLVDRLARWAPVPYPEAIKLMKRNVDVCVLDPTSFLTHYTVHCHKNGAIDVLESIVLPERNDAIAKLPNARALDVFDKISAMLSDNTIKLKARGLVVYKKLS